MNNKITGSLACLASVFSAMAAQAQVKDQAFKNWTVYSTTVDAKKVCYMTSYPTKKTGNTKQRGLGYFIVTNISNTKDETSVSSGYPYQPGSKVSVTFDNNKNYSMSLIKDEIAWIKNEKTEKEFIGQLKMRKSMNVKGISAKGTYSVDQYTLAGFSSAYSRMKALCK